MRSAAKSSKPSLAAPPVARQGDHSYEFYILLEGSVRVEASMFLNNSIGILSSGDTPALVNGTVLRNNIAPRGAARGPSTPPPSGLEQVCVGVLVFSRYACIRRAALF